MKQIQTSNAPEALGPYSQAIVVDGTMYCSGQIALDPQTSELKGDTIEEQTHQVIKNLQAVLEAGGSSLALVVKTTCYLTDLQDFQSFNKVYETYFEKSKPARATVEVAKLPKNAKVEIEAIAKLNLTNP